MRKRTETDTKLRRDGVITYKYSGMRVTFADPMLYFGAMLLDSAATSLLPVQRSAYASDQEFRAAQGEPANWAVTRP